MVLKIIIEVVLGIILISLSSSFWACIKSQKYLGKALSDYNELKKYFNFIGSEKIYQESQNVQPILGSYSNNMATWMKASFSALDKTRNMMLFFSIIVILASYFLGIEFLLINIVVFFLLSFSPLPASAKNNMISDVHTMFLNIYKWNSVEPVECKRFCTSEQSRIFKNVYNIILEPD